MRLLHILNTIPLRGPSDASEPLSARTPEGPDPFCSLFVRSDWTRHFPVEINYRSLIGSLLECKWIPLCPVAFVSECWPFHIEGSNEYLNNCLPSCQEARLPLKKVRNLQGGSILARNNLNSLCCTFPKLICLASFLSQLVMCCKN